MLCGCSSDDRVLCMDLTDRALLLREDQPRRARQCINAAAASSVLCWIGASGEIHCDDESRRPVVRHSVIPSGAVRTSATTDDQLGVESNFLCSVNLAERSFVCGDTTEGDPPVPYRFDPRTRLPEAAVAFTVGVARICFLLASRRVHCWNYLNEGPARREEMRLMDGETGCAIRLGANSLLVASSSNEVLVFGDPAAEGVSRWSNRHHARLRGVRGPISDVALDMEFIYAISGSSIYWWNYHQTDIRRRPQLVGSCDTGINDLRFVVSTTFDDSICAFGVSGQAVCGNGHGEGCAGFHRHLLPVH